MKFLIADMKMSHDKAEGLLMDLWDMITKENNSHVTMQWFLDKNKCEDVELVGVRCEKLLFCQNVLTYTFC